MPTYNEGSPHDPESIKNLEASYKAKFKGTNTRGVSYSKVRNQLEINVKSSNAPPGVTVDPDGRVSDPWADDSPTRQPFKENPHSTNTPKGYEDVAKQAREIARENFNRAQEQAKAAATGYERIVESAKAQTIGKASSTAEIETAIAKSSTTASARANIASAVVGVTLQGLLDNYVLPKVKKLNPVGRAAAYYDAYINFKLGKINKFELSQALEVIRNGNPSSWIARIKQIRNKQKYFNSTEYLADRVEKLKLEHEAAKESKKKLTSANLGGQEAGVIYEVTMHMTFRFTASKGEIYEIERTHSIPGPIRGAANYRGNNPVGGTIGVIYGTPEHHFENAETGGGWLYGYENYSDGGADPISFSITNITRLDGKTDPSKKTATTKKTPIVPSVIINKTYITNIYNQTPKTTDRPPEINKAKPTIIFIPAGLPVSVSNSDNSKTVEVLPPASFPSTITIPHPRTVESSDSNQEKKVPPLTINNPSSPSVKLETPGSGTATINIPGYNPITITPQTNIPQGALPIQDVQRQYSPVSETNTPTKPGTTPTTPTPTTTTEKPATTDDLEKFKKDLEKLINTGGLLAGLTPAIQTIGEKVTKIGENTTPESLTTAAAAGTCRTTQPGGCSRKMMDDAIGDINQNTNNKFKGLQDLLNTLLNGFNATLIEATWKNTLTINSKLGAAVPGGISGFLGRGFQMLRIPQILSVLTFITAVHNAAMLSSGLKDTLLSMISSFSGLLGFKDAEGNDYDFNSLFNKGIEEFFTLILGTDTVNEIKKDWIKYNRIYQAAANMLSAVQSMMSGLQQGVELVGNYVALIGNGIKAAGGVSEKAYKWMSEKMHLERTSKFLQLERFESSVQKATDTISNFDMIAQSGVQLKDSYKQFTDAKDEFKKDLSGEEEKKAKAEKEAKAKAKDPGYNADALNSAKE